MKDFKKIADNIMSDINANEELKKKTMERCVNKKHMAVSKLLIPAACVLIILGVVNISHILPLWNQAGEVKDPQNNIMIGADEGAKVLPGDSGTNAPIHGSTVKKWLPATLDEAKKDFGSSFLAPAYIPQDYKLGKINASGLEEDKASKIILSYFAGEESFMIIQEKTKMESGFINFEKIDINGATGLLKPDESVDNENANILDTELHWFKDGVHYSVMGLITKEEAVNIARSMK